MDTRPGTQGAQRPIDVWDVESFDPALRAHLDVHADVIRDYRAESHRLFEERERQTLRGPPEQNVHGPAYIALKESVTALMERRTIRAWHYARLTDAEIAVIRAHGMQPMDLDLIARRLDAAVGAGDLDRRTADSLFAASPFHEQVLGNREARIWLMARPWPADYDGVSELLDAWGGESISFNHAEGPLHTLLRRIARGRILEVAIPLAATTRAACVADNVIDHYGFLLGCTGGWGGGADIVAVEPIPPDWILDVHSEGDPAYEAMARGYPARFRHDDDA